MSLEVIDPLNLTEVKPRYQVEIQTGFTLVELPNGHSYDAGDVVDLIAEDFERIDADSLCATQDDLTKPIIVRGYFSKLPGNRWVAYALGHLATIDAVGDVLVSVRAPFALTLDNLVAAPVTAASGDITVEVLTEGTPSGAADAAANEAVNISHDGVAGSYTLTFGGDETAAIDFDATASEIEAILEALDSIGTGNVSVTGDPDDYDIEFIGDLAATNVGAITATEGADFIDATAVGEVQTVTVDGTGGTFTITYAGQTTPNLDWDSTAQEVEDALVGLSNIAPGDVEVTGGPGDAGGTTPYVLTWAAYLGAQAEVTCADSLTGGAGTATPGTTTPGVDGPGTVTVAAASPEGDPAGTPVTVQINTTAIDANSGPFGPNRELFAATEADVAEGEFITLEATVVADDFSAGVVSFVLMGAVA